MSDENGRRNRYEVRRNAGGERRVNARFDPETLGMLRALTVRYGSEVAAPHRAAYEALSPEQRALLGDLYDHPDRSSAAVSARARGR